MENRITGRNPQPIAEDDEEIYTDNPELVKLNEAVESLLSVAQAGLLQKALALSNEKCNNLIERLNVQVKDLTQQVRSVSENNSVLVKNLRERVESLTSKLEVMIQHQATANEETAKEVRLATGKAISTGIDYFSKRIDEETEQVKNTLKETVKELEQMKADIRQERKFHKVLFWATPILLGVQTVISLILLFV